VSEVVGWALVQSLRHLRSLHERLAFSPLRLLLFDVDELLADHVAARTLGVQVKVQNLVADLGLL